jgi:hypothetical protein
MNTRTSFIITLLVLVVASLGCNTTLDINPYTAEETIEKSFEVGVSPRVVVEMFNGTIQVEADAGNAVWASVTKRGSGTSREEAQQDLKNFEVTLTQEGGTVRIIARRANPKATLGNSGASATLKVPRGTALELRSSNGSVTVTGQAGDVTINTSNGKIEVDGGTGRLRLDTSNGSIGVDATNAVVAAQTSNGSITFNGSLAQGDQSFRTSNGRITLTLPGSASFKLDAETSNGQVASQFAINRTGGTGDAELRGTVGDDPSTFIQLRTSNGSIEVRKQ